MSSQDGGHNAIVASAKVKQTDHHELVSWIDGSLSIEHHQYQERMDETLDHARLTCCEARALRNFLNSEAVMRTLGLL
jgi:hypothetical protein